MKFIVISKAGEGAGLAKRLQDEGNEVILTITEPDSKEIYDGIVKKSNTVIYDKSAVYVFDMVGNGRIARDLMRRDYKVVGGSQLADELESDRQFAYNTARKVGIPTPKTNFFSSFDDG